MKRQHPIAPEHTAVRTALWRALHTQLDHKPHVFSDEIGAQLVDEQGWQSRPDMEPSFSKQMRASVIGRARFIEDLIEEQVLKGVLQYVILGAGLDTFALRRADLASKMKIFEIDQPGPQTWKAKRIHELGMTLPKGFHFVPVDFEVGQSWWDELIAAGFDNHKPAVIVSTGLSMYLTKEANQKIFEQTAKLAPQSTFATTFMLTLPLLPPKEAAVMEYVMNKAKESGTPFLSLFSPEEIVTLAKETGFEDAKYVSANDIYQRYFSKRTDDLNAGTAEAFLVATT